MVVTDPSRSSSMARETGSSGAAGSSSSSSSPSSSSSSSMARTEIVSEMKKNLLKFVKKIVDEEDPPLEAIDRVNQIFSILYDFKLETSVKTLDNFFRCHESKQIMSDPVIISSGETYDRRTIQSWLDQGKQTCPKTDQILLNRKLIPNLLVGNMIRHWCHIQGMQPPEPIPNQLSSLLEKLSSQSISDQEDAASQLSHLSYQEPSFRVLFSRSEVPISKLLLQLGKTNAKSYPGIQDHLIKCILNISSHEDNKRIIPRIRGSISLLAQYLTTGTDIQRNQTAAILWSLAKLDSNKVLIGKSGALECLVNVIQEVNASNIENAADALYELCTNEDNMDRVIDYGAVYVVLDRIRDKPVTQLVKILDLFCGSLKTLTILHLKDDVVTLMLLIIKLSKNELRKEHCVSVIHARCEDYSEAYTEVYLENEENHMILNVYKSGTERAREKAGRILIRLKTLGFRCRGYHIDKDGIILL